MASVHQLTLRARNSKAEASGATRNHATSDAEQEHKTQLPPRVILISHLHPTMWEALLVELEAAAARGLGVRIENMADDAGNVALESTIYAHPLRVSPSQFDDWWPHPGEWDALERQRVDDDGLLHAITDPRWSTHQARAVRLSSTYGTGCHQWLFDFSDCLLRPDLNYASFPHGDED